MSINEDLASCSNAMPSKSTKKNGQAEDPSCFPGTTELTVVSGSTIISELALRQIVQEITANKVIKVINKMLAPLPYLHQMHTIKLQNLRERTN